MRLNNRWVRATLALVVVVVVVLAARFGASQLGVVTAQIQRLGMWAPVAFTVLFAIAAACFVPAGVLTMTAGVLFGLGVGLVCAFTGALLGALLSFAVARYGIRSVVERRLRAKPKTLSVINSIGENGWRVAGLLRLSPVIPFSFINIAMAVTPIPFLQFAASCFAMLPLTLLYVYYGTVAGTIARAQQGHEHRSVADYVPLAVGLLVTLAVTIHVSRSATAALRVADDARRTSTLPDSPKSPG